MNIAKKLICVLAFVALQSHAEVTVPNSFTNGQTADADQINANFTALADGINDPPVVIYSGYCSGSAATITDTEALICLNTTTYNTASSHLSVDTSGAITVLTSGYYRITANTLLYLPAGTIVYGVLSVNSGTVREHWTNPGSSPSYANVQLDATRYLNAGDVIEVKTIRYSGTQYTQFRDLNRSAIEVIYEGQ